MNHGFSVEEIRNVIMTARVHCPGFSENMFESLMELEKHVADSGYLEVIQGILRLEEEKGVACTEALDACKDLMGQKTKLERLIPDLEKRAESLAEQIKRASAEYEQMQKAIATTQQDLEQIKNEHAEAEKKLVTFNKKLEKEKQRIEKEIEQCHKEADVSREEVTAASRLKKEAESRGFNIELMLDLSKEFAGYKNAGKELAEALKKHTSLKKYLYDLADWSKKEGERVTAEISSLESQKKVVADESTRLTNTIAQLQADIKGEEDLRRFYYRYVGVSGLMEHLASWAQVFFVRCTHPAFMITGAFDANSGNARFWTDKPPAMCPQCGYRQLVYDEKVYQSLGWPVGARGKLVLGEYNAQK